MSLRLIIEQSFAEAPQLISASDFVFKFTNDYALSLKRLQGLTANFLEVFLPLKSCCEDEYVGVSILEITRDFVSLSID